MPRKKVSAERARRIASGMPTKEEMRRFEEFAKTPEAKKKIAKAMAGPVGGSVHKPIKGKGPGPKATLHPSLVARQKAEAKRRKKKGPKFE